MNTTDEALQRINARFPLTKRDAGEYARFSASPLAVTLDWYEANGLGNVSVLHGKAMLGLMRMDTLVINSVERDVPLFSYDYISAMGNHTLLVEYYDTLLAPAAFDPSTLQAVRDGIATLPDHDLGEHWYDYMKLPASFAKRTKKAALPRLNGAFLSALDAYLALAGQKPLLSEADMRQKQDKAAAYVEGLLEKGGPSTDAFKQALGGEKTEDLFTRIVFGTR